MQEEQYRAVADYILDEAFPAPATSGGSVAAETG